MNHLLLVKHALPDIQPDVPAKHWLLGKEGRKQSLLLAERLRLYTPSVVITSDEPKAAETGQIISKVLSLPRNTAPGLHENDRSEFPYFGDLNSLEAALRTFFDRSDKRVIGRESAHEAQERFIKAVEAALEPHSDQDVIVVAHGTVNTLFVAAHNSVEPFALWKSWALGTFAVLSRPGYELLEPPASH